MQPLDDKFEGKWLCNKDSQVPLEKRPAKLCGVFSRRPIHSISCPTFTWPKGVSAVAKNKKKVSNKITIKKIDIIWRLLLRAVCVETQFTHVFHSNEPDRKAREGLCCIRVDNHRNPFFPMLGVSQIFINLFFLATILISLPKWTREREQKTRSCSHLSKQGCQQKFQNYQREYLLSWIFQIFY